LEYEIVPMLSQAFEMHRVCMVIIFFPELIHHQYQKEDRIVAKGRTQINT